MLTFGELFAGVGGFSLGFEQAGWVCRWQVEWDKHCQSVLARHWPDVERFGDVRDVAGGVVPLAGRADNGSDSSRGVAVVDGEQDTRSVLHPVDCITFGSPCQDLSVAGKRAGLAGERSGLFHEAIRIIKEMRDATAGTLPRFAIWENVAGALSSNKGDDFLAVLDAFAEIGALDIAWRLVDAQHFGVPQRRRRVFVVADFGGECAGALHAEPAGMRWHPPQGGTPGPETAGGFGFSVTNALTQGLGSGGPNAAHAEAGWLVPAVSPAVTSKWAKGTGGPAGDQCQNLVPFVKAKRASNPDDDKSWRADGPAPTLNQFDNNSESRATVLAIKESHNQFNQSELSFTLVTGGGKPGSGYPAVYDPTPPPTAVRRLTPRECERLMGWPDDHTRWRADGTEQADSHRYRQCGNGVAAPVAAWLAWNLKIALHTESETE